MAEQKHDVHGQEADAHAEVPAAHDTHAEGGHGSEPYNPLSVDTGMFLWFLGIFVIAGFILNKFAWKPILQSLDEREETIRKSLDDADRLRAEMEQIESTRKQTMDEAVAEAKAIVEDSRREAREAATGITHKAKEEALILVENATRDIHAARDQARAELRKESAELAVGLAQRILKDQLDENKGRDLTDQLIKEL